MNLQTSIHSACRLSKHLLSRKKFGSNISIAVRHASRNKVTKIKISPLFTLREVDTSTLQPNPRNFEAKNRPLVVLYDWLYASQSALDKYCDLYHDIGLDVLTVRGKLIHFLWPLKGKELAENLMKFLLWERP